jgi:expansin (peptidoglycan-binding protein)
VTEPRPYPHRRLGVLSPRWLAAGGVVILAAVVGIALLLQNGGSACAAPPATSAHSGKATFYDLGSGTGNCSFPSSPADDLFVALGPDQYAGGAACGTYLDVTGPKGKVRVKVTDSCPECAAGHLDLSRTAFKKIGAEVDGIIAITYRTVVNPSVPGPLSVRIKEGSSQYWFAALIDNHGNQLRSVSVARAGGTPHAAKRADYNYWIIDSGAGSGPFKIKVSDVYGRSATVSGIALSPGRVQRTTTRLSGSGGSVVKAPATKPATKSVSPRPSTTVSSAVAQLPESTVTAEATTPAEASVDLAAGSPSCR